MNCLICFQEKTLIQPTTCSHQFCKDCITLYIKDAINNGSVYQITCPSCKIEYNALIIKQYCENLYSKYLDLKQKAIILCSVCKENIKKHKCSANVCLRCGEIHQGECSQRCPNCLIPIEKISGCNHMICKCKYEFCWICKAKFTRYHYRIWNLIGCPFPGSLLKQIQPLDNPQLYRIAMVIPKLIAFLLILCVLIIVYPFFCFYITVQFHYKQFKFKEIRILLVLLFPLFYLYHFLFKGIGAVQIKLHSLT